MQVVYELVELLELLVHLVGTLGNTLSTTSISITMMGSLWQSRAASQSLSQVMTENYMK